MADLGGLRKDEHRILESMFAHEVGRAIGEVGNYPFQRIGKKLAARMIEKGLIEATERPESIGPLIMMVRGFELTHMGRILYCSTCDAEQEVSA